MFCPKCGTVNQSANEFCVNCGKMLRHDKPETAGYSPKPVIDISDSTIFAVFVTILCCFPLGVFAVYFAAKARGFAEAGERDKAYEASRLARTWCWTTLFAGLAFIFINLIIMLSEFRNAADYIF